MRQERAGSPAWIRSHSALLNAALALLFVLVMLWTLFYGRTIGMSDNGDFNRVMNASSLEQIQSDRAFRYVGSFGIRLNGDSLPRELARILFGVTGVRAYPSIQLIPVRISVAANLLWNAVTGQDPTLYRLWTLGLLYVLLYGLALFALFCHIPGERFAVGLVCKLVAGAVLCDVGYVSYFNSLYGEPLQIIGLVLCAAFALGLLHSEEPSVGDSVGFALSAALYGGSKFANIPVGLLFLLFLCFVIGKRLLRRPGLWLSILAAAVFLAGTYLAVPKWMSEDTNFNAVYYGVVRDVDADTAEAYLSDLGLDPGSARYAGNHAYVIGVRDAFAEDGYAEALNQVGKLTLLRFYLTHPGYLAEKLRFSLNSAGLIRPFYMANYGEGWPRMALSQRFSAWGQLRLWLGFDTVLGNLVLLAGALAVSAYIFKKKNRLCRLAFCVALAGAWCYHLLIPEITNGDADLAKHMFALEQLADLFLLLLLCAALESLAEKRLDLRLPVFALAALCLLVSPVAGAIRAARLERSTYDTLCEGAYVRFGSDSDGTPLTWLVTETWDGRAQLLCADVLAEDRCFSEADSNAWEESDLRAWLNGAFLTENFTDAQRRLLAAAEHPVILPVGFRDQAEEGRLDFSCSHLPHYLSIDYDDAYKKTAEDFAALPDAPLVTRLSEAGYRLRLDEAWWLMTPYYNNDYMVRCFDPDGIVLFQEAAEVRGVRPVIWLELDAAAQHLAGGSGSLRDPLVLRVE